jgi:hypothetical protein
LDFVHRLNYKIIKLQRFGSWILLPSSGKKGGREQKAYLLGTLIEPASLRLDRLSVLFPLFYLKTEAESSFRNVVFLYFYNLDDGQSPKEQFYILLHLLPISSFLM